jgi:hypothetical protein
VKLDSDSDNSGDGDPGKKVGVNMSNPITGKITREYAEILRRRDVDVLIALVWESLQNYPNGSEVNKSLVVIQ